MNSCPSIALALGLSGLLAGTPGHAQQPELALTLGRAVALALQHSPELALEEARGTVAEREVAISRSAFQPNLSTGSGAAYTHGFPQTPGGAAPSLFEVAYRQAVVNRNARGLVRESEQRSEIQRFGVDRVREIVIVGTATAYLELAEVRLALEAKRRARESARIVLEVTRERVAEGREVPLEVIRAEVAAAQVDQTIVELEGRASILERQLRAATGLPPDQPIAVSPEALPAVDERPLSDLQDLALARSPDLKQAAAEREARQQRLAAERGQYWPSIDLVGTYSVLSRRFERFFRRFDRNSVTTGLEASIPLFSGQVSAAVARARSSVIEADLDLRRRRDALELEVAAKHQRARELRSHQHVVDLQLDLAAATTRMMEDRLHEGHANRRDVEQARLGQLDASVGAARSAYETQRAQLELLAVIGELARLSP